jgi:hypothetical protein
MKLTQNQMILMHLQDYGSITSIQAMQEYGFMRLASRINDLKREGYNIISETMKSKNRFGETIHHSVYRLKEEKEN